MSTRKWVWGAIAVAALASQGAVAAGRTDLVYRGIEQGRPYVSGELLVQFRADADDAAKSIALRSVGAQRIEMIRSGARRGAMKGDLELVRLPTTFATKAAIRKLEASGAVDFAEPNWVYQHTATSNDTYYTNGSLWGMYGDATSPSNVYGSQAGEAWAAGHTCSSAVYVGVIDEGVMDTHEDLAGNVWVNPYDPVDGVDNDGNGYVDDVHGWDFDGNDSSTFDGTSDDHGTHVSGTIAGKGGNAKGVAGVCWSATLISTKFLGKRGGTSANAILAMDYLTDLKTRHGLNIVASNNSWGGGGYSQALQDAIERGGDADILFVAAAGNDGVDNDSDPHYPSSYDSDIVLAVASLNSNGTLSSFSNYGATTVDIGAPGAGIYSTVPQRARRGQGGSGYASYSGTSMATPHVTGAAALYASTHPGATALQIKQAILNTAVATSSLSGKVTTGSRLNVSSY